jgi:hypothetical protein
MREEKTMDQMKGVNDVEEDYEDQDWQSLKEVDQ